MDVKTSRGVVLTAKKGDFLVSEIDEPDGRWPIEPEIFEDNYLITWPGLCVKNVITLLVLLADVTNGDEDQEVTVVTKEKVDDVRTPA